jgi:putative peptidoglycan lipid II flippase
MVANMGLNLLLIFPLKHAGLALATSLSAYLNAGLLLLGLVRRDVYRPDRKLWRVLVQTALACVVLATVIGFGAPDVQGWIDAGLWRRIGMLVAWIGIGAAAYFVSLYIFGLRPRHLSARS